FRDALRDVGHRNSRLSARVSTTDATIEKIIMARQPGPPPSGLTSTFRPIRIVDHLLGARVGHDKDRAAGYPRPFNVYAQLTAFPRIPVNEGDLTTWGGASRRSRWRW